MDLARLQGSRLMLRIAEAQRHCLSIIDMCVNSKIEWVECTVALLRPYDQLGQGSMEVGQQAEL